MSTLAWTRWILVGAIVLLIAWDVVVMANSVDGDTISELIWDASKKRPVIAFAAGVVMGHLFWPS